MNIVGDSDTYAEATSTRKVIKNIDRRLQQQAQEGLSST
jgi:hypothetical protein